MSRILKKIEELGIRLPAAPKPVAVYVPAVRSGDLVFISGQIPVLDGRMVAEGPVPSAVSVEDATAAARQCCLNALAVLAAELDGDLDRVQRIVRVGVFVASDPGFTDQPVIANGASTLLGQIFGDAGRHARAAVGSVGLPLNASVEVEMVAQVAGP